MQRETITFPNLQARNLERRNFNLPQDFEGERNIVLMAFQRWHQSLVDSWIPPLKALQERQPELYIYELPILSSIYVLGRSFIDGGMAFAIPDKRVRETTLTVYTDVKQVLRALQIPNTETINIFLVDRAGQIFWRGEGGHDPERMADLERVVDA
ncbi:MAG: hypothetical protein MI924_35275 [Chloroflexales bacterium]|nr:hypothetical protein [Chloroflexales bacterium]